MSRSSRRSRPAANRGEAHSEPAHDVPPPANSASSADRAAHRASVSDPSAHLQRRWTTRLSWIAAAVSLSVAAVVAFVSPGVLRDRPRDRARSEASTPAPGSVSATQISLWTQEATQLAERGEVPRALALLERCVAADPAASRPRLIRGQLLRQAGDLAAAEAEWSRVTPAAGRDFGLAEFLLGSLALERRDPNRAEELWRSASVHNPGHLPTLERLAALLILQERGHDSREALLAIRRLRPWSIAETVAFTAGNNLVNRSDFALQQLAPYLSGPRPHVASGIAAVRHHLARGETAAAGELLQQLATNVPDSPELWAWAAELNMKLGDSERAAACVARCPPTDQSPLQIWRAHGLLHADRRDWELAEPCLARTVELDPDDAAVWHRLGQVRAKLADESASALSAMQQAQRLEQLNLQVSRVLSRDAHRRDLLPGIIARVAELLESLDRRWEACEWWEQGVQISPTDEQARARYQRLLAESPAIPEPRQSGSHSLTEMQNFANRMQAFCAAQPRVDWSGALAGSFSGGEAGASLATTTAPPLDGRPAAAASQPGSNPLSADSISRLQANSTAHSDSDLPIVFASAAAESGLDFRYFPGVSGQSYLFETLGGGVGVLDFDRDERPDLYFTQGCPIPIQSARGLATGPEQLTNKRGHRLYRQSTSGAARDVTLAAGLGSLGYGQGVAAADFDNDGFTDLAVNHLGPTVLYHNQGDGTFVEVTESSGVTGDHSGASLGWADLDRDGLLDLVVVTYVSDPYLKCLDKNGKVATCSPANFRGEPDVVYRNRGDGQFADITEEAGWTAGDGKGLGLVLADFNHDGRCDAYVANDGTPNFLFEQTAAEGVSTVTGNEVGTAAAMITPIRFAECGLIRGVAVNERGQPEAGMGVASGDFDRNGWRDIFVTNFFQETNTLYLNQGEADFVDSTRVAGLAEPSRQMLGFGTQAIDFDGDGWLDLAVANGHINDNRADGEPYEMPAQVFRNFGAARFRDVSRSAGPYFSELHLGRGLAALDWDQDGQPDIAIVNQQAPAALLLNRTQTQYSGVELRFIGSTANRDGIGVRVEAKSASGTQVDQLAGGNGYFASSERVLWIGLGNDPEISELTVIWPSNPVTDVNRADVVHHLPRGSRWLLHEGHPPMQLDVRSSANPQNRDLNHSDAKTQHSAR